MSYVSSCCRGTSIIRRIEENGLSKNTVIERRSNAYLVLEHKIVQALEAGLREPARSRAIRNVESMGLLHEFFTFPGDNPTPAEALNAAFSWMDSPEGESYWVDAYEGLLGEVEEDNDDHDE